MWLTLWWHLQLPLPAPGSWDGAWNCLLLFSVVSVSLCFFVVLLSLSWFTMIFLSFCLQNISCPVLSYSSHLWHQNSDASNPLSCPTSSLVFYKGTPNSWELLPHDIITPPPKALAVFTKRFSTMNLEKYKRSDNKSSKASFSRAVRPRVPYFNIP
jgi:hypothetical protein